MKTIKIKHKIGDKVWILDDCFNIVRVTIEKIKVIIEINSKHKKVTETYTLINEKTGFNYGNSSSYFMYKTKKEALNYLNNMKY